MRSDPVSKSFNLATKDGYLVPPPGTNVEFTLMGGERSLRLSSSGGGLFGRLMTRESYGALLNFWRGSAADPGIAFTCAVAEVASEADGFTRERENGHRRSE